jgi:hypothetical protein
MDTDDRTARPATRRPPMTGLVVLGLLWIVGAGLLLSLCVAAGRADAMHARTQRPRHR